MSQRSLPRRLMVLHAAPEAIAPMTRVILAKLGYVIVTAEEFESLGPEIVRRGPELRKRMGGTTCRGVSTVYERHVADQPGDGDGGNG